jgi:hypothetical protein
VRRIVIRKHRLDNQDPAARIHRTPTGTEDRETVVLRPVMDDVRKKIGIAAAWNSVEETPRLYRDAVCQAARLKSARERREGHAGDRTGCHVIRGISKNRRQ